jgi:hypothetical protein
MWLSVEAEVRVGRVAKGHDMSDLRWLREGAPCRTLRANGVADRLRAQDLRDALSDIVYIGRAWLVVRSDVRETAMRQRAEAALGRLNYEPAALSQAVRDLVKVAPAPQPSAAPPDTCDDLCMIPVAETQTDTSIINALKPLLDWIRRERALRDAQGKGGQSVGYSPSISPSVLRELERLSAPLVAQPSPETRADPGADA